MHLRLAVRSLHFRLLVLPRNREATRLQIPNLLLYPLRRNNVPHVLLLAQLGSSFKRLLGVGIAAKCFARWHALLALTSNQPSSPYQVILAAVSDLGS